MGLRINVLTIIIKNYDVNTNAATTRAAIVPMPSPHGLAVQVRDG